MNHLTVDDIINFVSLSEMNKEAVELSAAVNGHIRKCAKCLELVRAFQMIYDEFSRLNTSGDFRKFVSETISEETDKNENIIKMQNSFKEFDGYR